MTFSFVLFVTCSCLFLYVVNVLTRYKHPYFLCFTYLFSFLAFYMIDIAVNTNVGGTVCAIISGAMTLAFVELIIQDSKKEKGIKS